MHLIKFNCLQSMSSASSAAQEIFCVKCRKKVPCTDVTMAPITFTRKKSGKQGTRNSLHATCPNCKTNMKRFTKEAAVAK
jgi:hypothetical protein